MAMRPRSEKNKRQPNALAHVGAFFFASAFNVRIWTVVHGRRFDFWPSNNLVLVMNECL